MRIVVILLISLLVISPVLAETIEVSSVTTAEGHVFNFWQEFDITFFQTLPFATFWGYVLDQQFSNLMSLGSQPHWNGVFAFATVVSVGNAWIQANRVVSPESD